MTKDIRLLLIDPQNDFCDLAKPARPALPVPGADADMQRVGQLVHRFVDRWTRVGVTLDTHRRIDIAHPPFWRKSDLSPVSPFTEITAEAVRAGQFVPHDRALDERALKYLDELESRQRYRLMVWPIHCEIGTWGHNVHGAVHDACHQWEERHGRNVDYFVKGLNPWTEHYSAAQAEVPLADDPATQLNRELIDWANEAELLFIAGEASSHCVRATVEDLIEYATAKSPRDLSRMVLLPDCMSAVPGFESHAHAFFRDAQQHGVRVATNTEAATLLG